MQGPEMRHLHYQVMKLKNVSSERQGWRGKQHSDHGGPQCYAKELGLYREGIGKSLRSF